MKNFKALVKMANKEMKKLVNFLEENTGLYEGRNLKLYDIAYNPTLQEKWNLTDEQYNDLFNMYCELEYNFFIEWMKENRIKDTRNYWGRTSTFDLAYKIETYRDNRGYEQLDYGWTVFNVIEYYQNSSTDISYIINNKGKVDLSLITEFCNKNCFNYYYDEYIYELKQDLEYIANGKMFNDFLKLMHDSIEIDKYLTSFMENQVENFDCFIQFEIEENGFLAM